jgi:small acid-soluble spore protein F (minor alpha/beta-type SASP)
MLGMFYGNNIIAGCKAISFYIESRKGGMTVSRHQSIMSDALKVEIAKELGVYNTVATEGWGSVSSRDCGNIVKKAIEMAERNLARK